MARSKNEGTPIRLWCSFCDTARYAGAGLRSEPKEPRSANIEMILFSILQCSRAMSSQLSLVDRNADVNLLLPRPNTSMGSVHASTCSASLLSPHQSSGTRLRQGIVFRCASFIPAGHRKKHDTSPPHCAVIIKCIGRQHSRFLPFFTPLPPSVYIGPARLREARLLPSPLHPSPSLSIRLCRKNKNNKGRRF